MDVDPTAANSKVGGCAGRRYEVMARVAKRRRVWTLAQVEACPRADGVPPESPSAAGSDGPADAGRGFTWGLREPPTRCAQLVSPVDNAFRRSVGIVAEVYDQALMGPVASRYSDTLYPRFWLPANPLAALSRGDRAVYLLVHPRHWRGAPAVSLR